MLATITTNIVAQKNLRFHLLAIVMGDIAAIATHVGVVLTIRNK
jgi:hypothetical protein